MSQAERAGSGYAATLGFALATLGVLGCSSDEAGADATDGIVSAGVDAGPGVSESTGDVPSSTSSGDATSSGPGGATSMTPDDDDPGPPPVVLDVNAVPKGSAACDEQAPTIDFVEPTMVMILDHSGSMGGNFSDPVLGSISRWNALHNAVTFILESYAPVVEFGVKVFPSDSSCGVSVGLDVDPALDNDAAILSSIPAASSTGTGLTPAYEAFVVGAAALVAADPDRPRAALLLLDGDAGCAGSPPALTSEIEALFQDHGIPTYVVGVDISDSTRAAMNGYAEAGGVPLGMPGDVERFYNATDTTQLQSFMDVVIGDLLSCDLELNPAPTHPSLAEVDIDGSQYDLIDSKACEAGDDGWTYSVEYTQIRLCGAACEAYRDAQLADVAFFCPQG
ncbi:MAG: VWA domain-containing protein [Nannocystaceae bacterium]|nr:VWA domain-containing protein [Nannocystaceae bacterium]